MQFIAERKLLYSLKHSDTRTEFTIGISAPFLVQQGMMDFAVGEQGCSGCHVGIVGLDEKYPDVYGADSLQAVSLASGAVASLLKRLSKKYDFFHLSGEPYFDDQP